MAVCSFLAALLLASAFASHDEPFFRALFQIVDDQLTDEHAMPVHEHSSKSVEHNLTRQAARQHRFYDEGSYRFDGEETGASNASGSGIAPSLVANGRSMHGAGLVELGSRRNAANVLEPTLSGVSIHAISTTANLLFTGSMRTLDVVDHIRKSVDFKKITGGAVSQLEVLLRRLSTGLCSTREAMHSEYLLFQDLRGDLARIKEHCKQGYGLIPWLFSKNMPIVEVSEKIESHIDVMEEVLSMVSDDVFCPDFVTWLKHSLLSFTDMVMAWEERTGQKWFPKRFVRLRDVSGPINEELVREHYGISEDQFSKLKNQAFAAAMSNPSMQSMLPDRLLDDPMVDAQSKASFTAAINEARLIFGEMAGVSPRCRAQATAIHDENWICRRCPWCCHMPVKWPSIVQWMSEKFTLINNNDKYQWASMAYSNISGLVGAALLSPTSIMWLVTRLATTMSKKDVCEEALSLLENQVVPEEDQLRQWLSNRTLPEAVDARLELPAPGDIDCKGNEDRGC